MATRQPFRFKSLPGQKALPPKLLLPKALLPKASPHGLPRRRAVSVVKVTLDAPMREELDRLQGQMQRMHEEMAALRRLLALQSVHRLPPDPARQPGPQVPPESDAPAPESGLAAAQARGEALLARWVQEGVLVSGQRLARTWGRTSQALQQAVGRGELASVKVAGRRYYPAEFEHLTCEDVSAVSKALAGLSDSEKILFWLRPHGGLGGRTAPSALMAGERARALELAQAWAAERTHADSRP